MEAKIELDTGDRGIANVQTKKIEGELIAFLITAPELVDIKIISEEGYTLLDIMQVSGVNYLPISVQPIDYKGWGANYSNTKYFLNEKLEIFVSGGRNRKVKIKIRFE